MKKNMFYDNNIVLWHSIRIFISLALLLISVNARALTCPGSKDFVHNSGMLWGWSWDLPPRLLEDFTSPSHSWDFYSPYEKDFSPAYPLDAEIYFLSLASSGVTARLYCYYKLTGGESIYIKTDPRYLSADEFARINKSWEKNRTYYGRRTVVGYKCSTTAGAPDKCNVNFSG
ncbi:MAG: hypothetical protein K0R24_325 [Gammaproteobacteria bacterium]|jgi:hypothetical protein|nr:hypothetical protein [Gammaproteobacteria bacterium]